MIVSRADVLSVLPEIVLSVAGCLLLMLSAFWPSARRAATPLSLAAVGGYLAAVERLSGTPSFGGSLDGSMVAGIFGAIFAWSAIVVILSARPYLERTEAAGMGSGDGEFHALLLWSIVGVSLMARGLDLLVIFLGLETFSLCFYVLAAYFRSVRASAEAGLKYFLTGAFASSFTLFGIAILFGKTGTTRIVAVAATNSDALLACGVVFLLAGFGFKIALAPFHSWAPDVYAGMPTPAVAFLSVAPKAAAIVVLFRVLAALFDGRVPGHLQAAIAAIAVLSMFLGNLVALAQRDIKRLIAYSGIAHMGYVAIALAVFGREAFSAATLYLFAYAVTNLGAFAAVAVLFRDEGAPHSIGLLAGLGRRAKLPAFVLALSMISLSGIPATAGFLGKFFVFRAAVAKGLVWLAVVGVANSLVSLGYYLRVVYTLYMRPSIDEEVPPPVGLTARVALLLSAAGVLAIGLYPAPWASVADLAANLLPHLRP